MPCPTVQLPRQAASNRGPLAESPAAATAEQQQQQQQQQQGLINGAMHESYFDTPDIECIITPFFQYYISRMNLYTQTLRPVWLLQKK